MATKQIAGRTITAGELIELLQDLDPEALVAFSSDYGDHCHTQQVHTIRGEVENERIYESAYSDSGFAVVKESNEQYHQDDTQTVFIIS